MNKEHLRFLPATKSVRPAPLLLFPACLVIIAVAAACSLRYQPGEDTESINRHPEVFPPAQGTVIPSNIAPLNFIVKEEGERFFVRISGEDNETEISISSSDPVITVPEKRWKKLLKANRTKRIVYDVYCYSKEKWVRYASRYDTVAVDNIDPYLVYRKIPLCLKWTYMCIYQRNVQSFEEEVLFHNRNNRACFNCHTFRRNNPKDLVLQIRSAEVGTPMLLGTTRDGDREIRGINLKSDHSHGKAGFSTWHPQEDIIAYSLDGFRLILYSGTLEPRQVGDVNGDLAIYSITDGKLSTPPVLATPDRIETFPEWSADGKFLYFSSSPQLPFETHYRDMKCDLMSISYEAKTETWGELDTLLTAAEAGGSIIQTKCSPDGRFLLVTVAPYGHDPIDKIGAGLGLFDLKDSSFSRPELTQGWIEGWHCWSLNSRWIVFNSKSLNKHFSRLNISHVDSSGRIHRPFLLPRKDPSEYESSMIAYNKPELVTGRVEFTPREFEAAMEAYRGGSGVDGVTEASSNVSPHGLQTYRDTTPGDSTTR